MQQLGFHLTTAPSVALQQGLAPHPSSGFHALPLPQGLEQGGAVQPTMLRDLAT